ncbi:hypothetical protein Trydic_g526 [Trypoxylus dichotomus]
MRYILYRALRFVINTHKLTAVTARKFLLPVVRSSQVRTICFLNATVTLSQLPGQEYNQQESENDIKFLSDVKKACVKNDDALKELMEVLTTCVIEISKEYQENAAKQIEVIRRCTQVGPVGEHWDELTKYRVEATELRQELTKYEMLVQKVGQMAYNQAVTSLLSGVEDAMDLLEKYKPLTQPRKCVKCEQKNVRKAYHVMCTDCGKQLNVCTKCCQTKEIIPSAPNKREEIKLDNELQQILQSLPERKRRTFIRFMNKTNKDEEKEDKRDDLLKKLNQLSVSEKDSDINFSDLDSDEDDVNSKSSK